SLYEPRSLAQPAQPVDALCWVGSVQRDVASTDEQVEVLALDVLEHGVESRQVPVDVVEAGDSHVCGPRRHKMVGRQGEESLQDGSRPLEDLLAERRADEVDGQG